MRVHVKAVKQVRVPGPCEVCEQEICGSAFSVLEEPDGWGEVGPGRGYRVHPGCASRALRLEFAECERRRAARSRAAARMARVNGEDREVGR